MNVVRHLPEQLILAHAPWLFGGFLIVAIVGCSAAGLTLLLAGETAGLFTVLFGAALPGAIFAMTVKREQVILNGTEGVVVLRRQSLWAYEQSVHPLLHLTRADVQYLGETARPVLIFADGPHALIEAYVSAPKALKTAEAINDWHQNWRAEQRPHLANS